MRRAILVAAAAMLAPTVIAVTPSSAASPPRADHGHVAAAGVSVASRFVPLAATTVLDTSKRKGLRGAFAAGRARTLRVAGRSGVPTDATAVALQVVLDRPAGNGTATVWPAGSAKPAHVVSVAGAKRATSGNEVITPLGKRGGVEIATSVRSNVIAAVHGYWVPAATATAGRWRGTVPLHSYDSRKTYPHGYAAYSRVSVAVPVPTDGASAAVLAVTVLKAKQSGTVTLWTGRKEPSAPALWLSKGASATTTTTLPTVGVKLGYPYLYVNADLPTGGSLLVDVLGWYTGPAAVSASEGLFVPLTDPVSLPRASTGGTARFTAAGVGGIPKSRLRAVATGVTESGARRAGTLTSYASTTPTPPTRLATFSSGGAATGTATEDVGTDGQLAVTPSTVARLTVDVTGWYLAPPVVTSGKRLHYIYAIASDAKYDAAYPDGIRQDAERAGDWLMTQNPGQRYRWQTDGLGYPLVTVVHLTQSSSQLADVSNTRQALIDRGYDDPQQIYVVYVDALGSGCGVTSDASQPPVYSVDFMNSCQIRPDVTTTGWPYGTTYLMTHEETHALGAVPSCAPHYDGTGHVGNDNRDILYAGPKDRDWQHLMLDPGHDDYFKTGSTTCLDIANDPIWFAPR